MTARTGTMQLFIIYENLSWKKELIGIIFFVFILLSGADTAVAHKITVFAWTEGDTVHVESKFSGGKKVRHGQVTVYDPQENQLVNGRTDEQGEFSFKAPEKTDLKIVVMAGMGHRGEWTIPAEEIDGANAGQTTASEASKSSLTQNGAVQATASSTSALPETGGSAFQTLPVASGLSPEDIERIVEKVLDKKLKPIMKMLIESQEDHGPSLTDIFGGIGYILGLMGIGAYFNFQKK
ncbi:MAG: hypothetical protein DRI57_08260 [Deltaproteobacteria bacterium]|nr:MAG: hypothetical protein DRI57_08260 [Deltaproteobacteria bacterium]